MADWARLLSECWALNSAAGSNPALPALNRTHGTTMRFVLNRLYTLRAGKRSRSDILIRIVVSSHHRYSYYEYTRNDYVAASIHPPYPRIHPAWIAAQAADARLRPSIKRSLPPPGYCCHLVCQTDPSLCWTSLKNQGLLTSTIVRGEAHPSRKEFQLTEAGRRILRCIDSKSGASPHVRCARIFLARLYFATQTSPEAAAHLIHQQQAACHEWLQGLQERVQGIQDGQNSSAIVYDFPPTQITGMLAWLSSLKKKLPRNNRLHETGSKTPRLALDKRCLAASLLSFYLSLFPSLPSLHVLRWLICWLPCNKNRRSKPSASA